MPFFLTKYITSLTHTHIYIFSRKTYSHVNTQSLRITHTHSHRSCTNRDNNVSIQHSRHLINKNLKSHTLAIKFIYRRTAPICFQFKSRFNKVVCSLNVPARHFCSSLITSMKPTYVELLWCVRRLTDKR